MQTVSNNSFKIYIDISSNPPSPLVENPNAPDIDGDTPIYMAAEFGGNLDVKFLAPLTDNPNAPNKLGSTPVSIAVRYGYTEILNILAPLTNNPNAHDSD